jgi:Bardet-Biedl syndrome 7 protein
LNLFRNEVEELQRKVIIKREGYQIAIKSDPRALSTIHDFRVNDRFELNRDDATYNLTIESEIPIDNVLLQCDVILDILDVEKNSAVMSFSDCDPKVNSICFSYFEFVHI